MHRIEAAFADLKNELPDSLPLVDKLVESFCGEQPLSGVTALLFQNQTGAQFAQVQALINLGLKPENIIWVDIPYASNQFIRQHLIKDLKLIKENLHHYSFGLLEPFALCQRARVNKIVRRLLERPPEELLVLDDGAYLIESAMCFKNSFPKLAIVEQSRRGMVKFEESPALQFQVTRAPMINVADAEPTSLLEPPFVAMSITQSLARKLSQLNFTLENKRILVLGYGRIGTSVTKFIHSELGVEREQITIYDKKYDECNTAPESIDGFPFWHQKDFDRKFDLIVGCSGQTSFTVNDYVYLNDGGMMVSCSSGQIEFGRREFIEIADLHKNDDIKILKTEFDELDLHADIAMEFPHRNITMLNGAWPINYGRKANNIPVEYMQPTICMMVFAAVQAVESMRNNEVGVKPLDSAFCKRLIKDFGDYLGGERIILD